MGNIAIAPALRDTTPVTLRDTTPVTREAIGNSEDVKHHLA